MTETAAALDGVKVLVVEDETIVAMLLEECAKGHVERRLSHGVRELEHADGMYRVSCGDEAAAAPALVIAAGGLVAGGLVYSPGASSNAAELPADARPTLHAGIDAPVTLGSRGTIVSRPSTLFGVEPEAIAWPFTSDAWLERAGIVVDEDAQVAGATGLFAAGDVAADAPRAWLSVLESGARAGARAARGDAT